MAGGLIIDGELIEPQLPTAVKNPNLYINDDRYSMSQKLDGHRVLVHLNASDTRAYTRNGLERELQVPTWNTLQRIPGRWVFDGELLDIHYHIFDVLFWPQGDLRSYRWEERQYILNKLFSVMQSEDHKYEGTYVYLVKQHLSSVEKRIAYDTFQGYEGVVFAEVRAPYYSGRTKKALKYKFVNDVDCVVIDSGFEDKDNFVLGVYRDGKMFECGRVSALTGDGPKVKVGDVVTVTCLYTTDTGKLYQPVKPRLRNDKPAEECTFDQITVLATKKEAL